MFDWVRNILTAPAKTAKALFTGVRRNLRAYYDAAVTTDENRRHWANAVALSADAAANPARRKALRDRARYEAANSSYLSGMLRTLGNDVVGTGPRLQMLAETIDDDNIDGDDLNSIVEDRFAKWAAMVNLPAKLRTMRESRARDGETFALLVNNPALGPMSLDVQLVDCDRVTSLLFNPLDTSSADGITYDQYGNPISYSILRNHPYGDTYAATNPFAYDEVGASQVIHWYREDRPGQSRGVPEIAAALPLFAQLRRYTLAVIAAAETAADFAMIMYTKTAPDADDERADTSAWDGLEITPRMLATLPDGYEPFQMKAEQPTTTYPQFHAQVLNEAARCLSMPFNIAACNSSSYNYASGRLDHQTYFIAIKSDRDDMERIVLDRIFAAWFYEAVRVTGYLPQAARAADYKPDHQWFWDGREHVDPVKEATADDIRLKNNSTTLARIHAQRGDDYAKMLKQRGRERRLEQKYGIVPVDALPKPESAPIPANKDAGDE